MDSRRRIARNRRRRVWAMEQRRHDASVDAATLPTDAEKRATEVKSWLAVWEPESETAS